MKLREAGPRFGGVPQLCEKLQKIRPFLHNFTFVDESIKLNISFINSEGRTLRDGHVVMIFIGRNHAIYYEAYDPITNSNAGPGLF